MQSILLLSVDVAPFNHIAQPSMCEARDAMLVINPSKWKLHAKLFILKRMKRDVD